MITIAIITNGDVYQLPNTFLLGWLHSRVVPPLRAACMLGVEWTGSVNMSAPCLTQITSHVLTFTQQLYKHNGQIQDVWPNNNQHPLNINSTSTHLFKIHSKPTHITCEWFLSCI